MGYEAEKDLFQPEVDVYFQANAWADLPTIVDHYDKTLVRFVVEELQSAPHIILLDNMKSQKKLEYTERIKSNNARRRHMKYLGKLMRDIDAEPIVAALAALHEQKQGIKAEFHALEALRDEVLARGLPGVELVMSRWVHGDRQQLRQLILQYQREVKQNKPPAASRKLFKYLRELSEQV